MLQIIRVLGKTLNVRRTITGRECLYYVPDLHRNHGNDKFWPFSVLQCTYRKTLRASDERQLCPQYQTFRDYPDESNPTTPECAAYCPCRLRQ